MTAATSPESNAEEPSAGSGWLSFFFGSGHRRRLIVAFAAAIALHEIAAGFFPPPATAPQREIVTAVEIVTLQRRAVPTPTPRPTPVVLVRTPAIAPARQRPRTIAPGRPAARRPVRARSSAVRLVHTIHHSKPAPVHVATGAQSITAGAGPGGAGTGQSGTGNGTGGAPAANEPCGYVEFVNVGGLSKYDRRTGGYFVNIRMTVHFPDHHTESVRLDYPWYYPSQAANPWSAQNLANPNFPVTLQTPPPGQAQNEPPLLQYVIAHSTPDGYTLLKNCPGGASTGM